MAITYNFVDIVSETIESVLEQDYPNLEFIIADDASTDGTQKILQSYANKYPSKIRLILNEKNLGITGNCNAAFFACTGDLIAILGGDDLFLPGKISAQVAAFVADTDVVLSYHPVDVFDSATGKTLYITNQIAAEDTPDAFSIIKRAGIPGASSVMVRRDACPEYGFDPRIPHASDWKQQIDVALQGKVVKIDKVLGRYRKHIGGVSNRKFDLIDESLSVLDLTLSDNPNVPGLSEAVRIGKVRYLAGEAYNQMSHDPARAEQLLNRALEFDPNNRRLQFMKLINGTPPLRQLSRNFLPRLRRFLKRWSA
jgi:glycosyltransferase involved in cell wall biosynthesis